MMISLTFTLVYNFFLSFCVLLGLFGSLTGGKYSPLYIHAVPFFFFFLLPLLPLKTLHREGHTQPCTTESHCASAYYSSGYLS